MAENGPAGTSELGELTYQRSSRTNGHKVAGSADPSSLPVNLPFLVALRRARDLLL